MVLNIRKRVLAGLMLVLAAVSIVFAQDRSAAGSVDFSLRSVDGPVRARAGLPVIFSAQVPAE